MERPKPLVLIILDGWGVADAGPANAIKTANTPNFDRWLTEYPYTELETSGKAVGLPEGQMGNSEVGHLNIGAGRIVPQEFTRISDAIDDGSFYQNPVLIQAIDSAKRQNSNVHLMGLLSDGGVHSHIEHLFALLKFCKERDIDPLLHIFLDGRDVPPRSALTYMQQLEQRINELGTGHRQGHRKCGTGGASQIATVMGRYYAMDRDRRWERVQKAYEAMVYGKGYQAATAEGAIKQAYARGENDEFVQPTVVGGESGRACRQAGVGSRKLIGDGSLQRTVPIAENDSVVFFNFRPDRAREITRAFIDPDFDGFNRGDHPPHVFFTTFTQYDETFDIPVAFAPTRPTNILADVLAKHNLKQLRIAETEKYAHVTFFFNGGEETERPLEERILIPSPKVATYDLKPEMSANEVIDEVIKQIHKDRFDVIILNFANPDMVGHSGIFKAAVKAIETVDRNLGEIVEVVVSKGGLVLITADHGNADKMMDVDTDKPFTAHTTNKAPFLLITPSPLTSPRRVLGGDLPACLSADMAGQAGGWGEGVKLRPNGILADIAPTILDILGIEKPKEMTGKSLILESN